VALETTEALAAPSGTSLACETLAWAGSVEMSLDTARKSACATFVSNNLRRCEMKAQVSACATGASQ